MAQLSCGYRNSSDRMVIVRCIGPEEFFLERVVFPFELLSFLAPPESSVQIWTHGLGGPELLETIAVAELCFESESAAAAVSFPPSIESLADRSESSASEWQKAV